MVAAESSTAVILSDGGVFRIDESWLSGEGMPEPPGSLKSSLVDREKEMIEAALTAAHGRVAGPTGAAVRLGLPRQTLESRIASLGINKNRFRA